MTPGTTDGDDRQAILDLAADALLDGPRRYTTIDVCARAGCDVAMAEGLWRAMGFPDVPNDEVAFTDSDVDALRAALELQDSGVLDEHSVRAQTRVMSQALATVAAAHVELTEPEDRDLERMGAFVTEVLPALDDLLVYLYRRHLLDAVERSVLLERPEHDQHTPLLAVGFADLVGFTRVANSMEEDELSVLVEGFTQDAADVVADCAGRVVKMIGDEVMFTSPDPTSAATTAWRLVHEVGDRGGVPPLRAGVAAGAVLLRHGDVFGRPVNLAHRLVDVARPGTVVVDEAVAEALGEDGPLQAHRIASIRRLRGFDRLRLYALRAAEP